MSDYRLSYLKILRQHCKKLLALPEVVPAAELEELIRSITLAGTNCQHEFNKHYMSFADTVPEAFNQWLEGSNNDQH